jgi:hypothetical protein
MFFSYITHLSDLDQRRLDLIGKIKNILDPQIGDVYYIMDPYLDVVQSIQDPLKEDRIEDESWSFLLTSLAKNDVQFKIITRVELDGLISINQRPPFSIADSGKLYGATIEICKYTDTKYEGLTIHDRYILKENGSSVKGLHLGPSLADIQNKDVSLTVFSKEGVRAAIICFKDIWQECINRRGWKKG